MRGVRVLLGLSMALVACDFGGDATDETSDESTDSDESADEQPADDDIIEPMIDAPGAGACEPVEIRAAASHTCIRVMDGRVLCWGHNSNGQIGSAATETCGSSSCNPRPTVVPLPGPATGIGVGDQNGCAIVGSDVLCWGGNSFGQLGTGTAGNTQPPTVVPFWSNALELAGGANFMCARDATGMRCVGGNDQGQLATGNTSMSLEPVAIDLPPPVTAMSVGFKTICAVVAGKDVECWGSNIAGQTDQIDQPSLDPEPISLVAPFSGVVAAEAHMCVIHDDEDRNISCRGANATGQLGDGTRASRNGYVQPDIRDVVEIRGNADHTCARTESGDVLCWGAANTRFAASPMPVDLPGEATAIASGAFHDCAILEDNTVRCWGYRGSGQLGNGELTGSMNEPTPQLAYGCPD